MGRIRCLLDTNILSEPVCKRPNEKVMQQFAQFDGEYVTAAIVWHELHYGCALLSHSKRKMQLKSYLSMLFENGLGILPYDQSAVEWFALQRVKLKAQGKVVAYADGEIAAIAVVNNLTLVTRNTRDFSDLDDLMLTNWF